MFQTEQEPQVPAAPFDELIFDWHKVNGVRPRGAPVGMTVASDGAIWLVEDKNQSIMRIDAEPVTTPTILLRCETRTEQQIEELLGFIAKNRRNQNRLSQIRTQLVERHCMGCHSNFDLEAGMDDAQKDATVLRFILRQDGWVYPGDPEAGRLHSRVRGMGGESIMPPNGHELIAKDAIYRQLLDTLDRMVIEMVPGKRMRINRARLPAVPLHNRDNKICGEIPNDTLVMVVNKRPKERPGSSRIFRPADRYLNGDCADRDGYYIGKVYLGAL